MDNDLMCRVIHLIWQIYNLTLRPVYIGHTCDKWKLILTNVQLSIELVRAHAFISTAEYLCTT